MVVSAPGNCMFVHGLCDAQTYNDQSRDLYGVYDLGTRNSCHYTIA